MPVSRWIRDRFERAVRRGAWGDTVSFDLAHEFPADRGVVGQLANYPPNREILSRGYEALPTVDRGRQVASPKDGTRAEAD